MPASHSVRAPFPVRIRAWAAAMLAAGFWACAAETSMESADRDVALILDRTQARAEAARVASLQRPREAGSARGSERRDGAPTPSGEPTSPGDGAAAAAIVGADPVSASESDQGSGSGAVERRTLTLAEALRLAVRSNREMIAQREALYLTALSLVGTRHEFAPQLAAALSYLFSDSDGATASSNVGATAGVTQILPTGGRLSLNGSSSFDTSAFQSSLAVGLTQPLLRGGGHHVAWEPLTQAERSVVYAVREFEIFRESFSIDVARRFYNLVQQKQSVDNERRNLEKLEFTRKKAEALFAVGRGKELDALRARRDELSSQNRVLETEEGYLAALESFRIFLGLEPGERIDVAPEDPHFEPIRYDVRSAIEVALANRLDLINRTEQLEDVERSARLARNALLPSFDLGLNYGLAAAPSGDFADQRLDDNSWSASLRLELPVDRLRERNAVRSSQIALARARRGLEEFRQQLAVGVENAFRELERRRKSLEIQEQLIEDQERNVRVAELLFERGQNDNRDVVEALQALVDAQNALIREKVAYAIARLELIRDLGLLFIDAEGMWLET